MIYTVFWVVLSILVLIMWRLIGHSEALRDADAGTFSLAKTQMAFWGLLVLGSGVGICILTRTIERIPMQTLTLIGISGATALSALLIGARKPGDAVTTVPRSPATLRQFFYDLCDDGKGVSFHRIQVIGWTLLLGLAFVIAVGERVSLPEFPESLLLLMGISNATYLGFKIPEQTAAPAPAPVPAPVAAPARAAVPAPGAVPNK